MTTDNLRTRWPLNMRFASYDVRPGEQALTESDLFYAQGLRLLCGVNLQDVSIRNPERFRRQELLPDCLVDYLVCKGDAVLLAIHLTDRDAWYGKFFHVPGLSVAEITGQQFSDGDVETILVSLENILQSPVHPWFCRLQPCPPALTESMRQNVLLEQEREGLAPTEYGMCCGLVRVVQFGCQQAMCSARTARKLPKLLAQMPPQASPQDKIPFDSLLQAYRSGLDPSGQVNADLVQEVMDMPISAYMDGFPDELAQLKGGLSQQCRTYGDVAHGIYELLHKSGCEDSDEAYERGMELMRALAAPTLEDRKVLNAGRRKVSGLSDELANRYYKPRDIKEIRSFSDCISSTRAKLPAGMRLACTPHAGFFQGVGILARSGYPAWVSKTLRSYMSLDGRYLYMDLIATADMDLEREHPMYQSLGARLLYLLLIEPYCMITEKNQKESKAL